MNVSKNEKVTLVSSELSYVKIPRWVFNMLYGEERFERLCGRVFLSLVAKSFYREGTTSMLDGKRNCKRGELVSTYQSLAEVCDISFPQLRRVLNVLVERGLVEVVRLKYGTRFIVVSYEEIIAGRSRVKTGKEAALMAAYEEMVAFERRLGGRRMDRQSIVEEE